MACEENHKRKTKTVLKQQDDGINKQENEMNHATIIKCTSKINSKCLYKKIFEDFISHNETEINM